jgi:hypothetical protein
MLGRKRCSYLLTVALIVAMMSMLVGAGGCQSVSTSAKSESVTLTGKWTDNYNFKYLLIAVGGRILGYVNTTAYGTWLIEGNYTGNSFAFTAHNLPPIEEGAAKWFTYTGTHTLMNATGRWVNSADASGTFTMTRGW